MESLLAAAVATTDYGIGNDDDDDNNKDATPYSTPMLTYHQYDSTILMHISDVYQNN